MMKRGWLASSLMLIVLSFTGVGCGSAGGNVGNAGLQPSVLFTADVQSAGGQIMVDLGIYNEGELLLPINGAFAGAWTLTDGEGRTHACGESYTLPVLGAGAEHRVVLWEGYLDPGPYTITWGAPDYGAVKVAFNVTERQGLLAVDVERVIDSRTYPPAAW